MSTNEYNDKEAKPENINPNELGFTPSANETKAQEKVDIKESGLGRDQGQTPADEHIENRISQIDEGTKEIQKDINSDKENKLGDGPQNESETAEDRDSAGYMNDANGSADRDTGNNSNSEDWNSQESRTARHK